MTSAHDKAVYSCNTCVGKGCPECDGSGVKICRRQSLAQSVDVEEVLVQLIYQAGLDEKLECFLDCQILTKAVIAALRDRGMIV